MQERKVQICNKLGLHVRAATLLVQAASDLDPEITLHFDGQSADAKSIMEVLMLAATNGSDVKVTAEGESEGEEGEALQQICALIENRFNEPE